MLITLWQTVLKGSLAALAILLAGYATEYLLNQPENPFLLASMGASAVILFALPQSPMARPWAVTGGHLLSAITGITCAALLKDTHVAAAVAAGTSLLVMSMARCVHPPGGATALLAVLGGDVVQAAGYAFLLIPAINLIVLLVIARLCNRGVRTTPPTSRHTDLLAEDWIAALNDIGVVMTDMSESGLENLHRLASGHAHRRREKQPDPANIRQPPS
jgi:CBS domain-containing membrane protein